MTQERSYRATFTLSAPTATGISYIAKRMGITQSALLNQLLAQPIADLKALLETIPPTPDHESVLRMRGASVDVINRRITELQGVLNDPSV